METIKQAIESKKTLTIRDLEGYVRVVEPYCLTQGKTSILLHCYQVGGYSASGERQGWKNIRLENIQKATLGSPFEHRPEFRPERLKCL